MNKKFIKMNNNKNYLSLGNLFNIIKNIANNKSSAMQTEIFYTIFKVNNVNTTTINNYCIGYRAIGIEYKKIFIDLYNKYKEDNKIFIDIILNIISILDEHIYIINENSINDINNNKKLKKVIIETISLSKTDINISNTFIEKLNNYMTNNDLYNAFINILYYVILENKQPIYNQDFNIVIDNELKDYLKINLFEGVSYINSLKELAKKNNMYANAELGSLEYSGLIAGEKRIEESFNYYLKAANKNHPKSCWMIANLILTNKITNTEIDALEYLNKSIELGSIAGLNTLGNCYRLGIIEYNLDKAIDYYKKACEYGYVYAYNNIGLIYEKEEKFEEAQKYFKISADLGESWALNKVGEYYRKKNNLKDAYIYYLNSSLSPINERNYYSFYNLAKYYYLKGNKELGIKKDLKKTKEYLLLASKNNIKEATELLNEINH